MRAVVQIDPVPAAAPKSQLKRLFERQVQVLRVLPAEHLSAASAAGEKDEPSEPSSLCLDSMVRSFLEGGDVGCGERGATVRCCNCFQAGDTSDDEDGLAAAYAVATNIAETIKGLVHCASLRERNLLADSILVKRHRTSGARTRDLLRLLAESRRAAGHDAALCLSVRAPAPAPWGCGPWAPACCRRAWRSRACRRRP